MLGMSPALLAGSADEAEQKKSRRRQRDQRVEIDGGQPQRHSAGDQVYSMAPRASSLDGKTIYVVDATSF